MKKLNPSDLEKIIKQGGNSKRLNIDEFVRDVSRDMKRVLLESKIEAMGLNIKLTTTRTRFGGEKFWFVCPGCGRRCGVLYRHSTINKIACRKCLGLVYRK